MSSAHPGSCSLEQQIALTLASGCTLDAPELMKVCGLHINFPVPHGCLPQAVMELQQENTDLRRENTDLKTRIVELKLQLKSDKNANSAASIEQEMKADVKRAAKYFHMFMSPSIPGKAFKIDKPMFPHGSPECYDDGQEKYGIAVELHHSIPPKYLLYLRQHEQLVKEVRFYLLITSGKGHLSPETPR